MNASLRVSETVELGDVDDFRECCADHVWSAQIGILALQVAADNLQSLAERWGLVSEYGQDTIQTEMALAFAPEPDLPPDYAAQMVRRWELADPRDRWSHVGEPPPAPEVERSSKKEVCRTPQSTAAWY